MGKWRAVLEGCIHSPGGEGKSQEGFLEKVMPGG